MKFRRRLYLVEAEQMTEGHIPKGVFGKEGGQLFVKTSHGDVIPVNYGDWVITELDGSNHYPCKADIFDAIYEPAEES